MVAHLNTHQHSGDDIASPKNTSSSPLRRVALNQWVSSLIFCRLWPLEAWSTTCLALAFKARERKGGLHGREAYMGSFLN